MENKNVIYLLIIAVLLYFYYHNKVTATITHAVSVPNTINNTPNPVNIPIPMASVTANPVIPTPPRPVIPKIFPPPPPPVVNVFSGSLTPVTPASQVPEPATPVIKKVCVPITPLQAIQQAWQQVKNPSPHDKAATLTNSNAWIDIILANSFQFEINRLRSVGTCSGQANSGVSDLQLTNTAGSLTLTSLSSVSTVSSLTTGFAAAGTALGTAIPIIGIAVAGIVGLFSIISRHHAQAVGVEQSTECALLPAASNYLSIIDEAVMSGQATPQQGIDALTSLADDFYKAALAGGQAGGLNNTGNVYCNALCEYWTLLTAVTLYRKSIYQCMINNSN